MWAEFRGHSFILTMSCGDARALLTILERVDTLPYGLARLQGKLERGLSNEEGQHYQNAFWQDSSVKFVIGQARLREVGARCPLLTS